MNDATEPEVTFGIGAVAKATGIPVETLRIWERRYSVVEPHRSADNKRYYTPEDVRRLRVIRQLVDRGHAISNVAALDDEAMGSLLRVHGETTAVDEERAPVRFMVCGEWLPAQLQNWSIPAPMATLVGAFQAYGAFEQEALTTEPELLILEVPFLRGEQIRAFAELCRSAHTRSGVLVYGYGQSDRIAQSKELGLKLVRGPLHREQFTELLGLLPNQVRELEPEWLPQPAAVPPKRFDNAELAKLAGISTSIRCECPQHLADLVFRVQAFERYSADCENRNDLDAAIHAHLRIAAGLARATLEEALAYLVEQEGIVLEE